MGSLALLPRSSKELGAVVSQVLHCLRAPARVVGLRFICVFPLIVDSVLVLSGTFYVRG